VAELREVHILIGKRNYRIQTALDDPTLERIRAIISEITSALGDDVDQEKRLMLTCLQLAYSVEKISWRLGAMTSRLEEAEEFTESEIP
jgi:hypothetical protein